MGKTNKSQGKENKIIECEALKVKAFVRGEIDIVELLGEKTSATDVSVKMDGDYKISADDIVAALKKFKSDKTEIDSIFYKWFEYMLYVVGKVAGLMELIGEKNKRAEDISWWECDRYYFPKNVNEACFDVFYDIYDLNDNIDIYDDIDKELLYVLDEGIELIENAKYNDGKPKNEWKLTKDQKLSYVKKHDDNAMLREESKEQQELFKRYLEELCEAGNTEAIAIKGYCCYGEGNPVYGCDWFTARDCFLKLMEIGDEHEQARSANTLGYIYYYGRCNNGEPEYDEAFKYFSLGAFYSYHESMYKVGDMLAAGKGPVPKNKTAAYNLYSKVYEYTLPDFIDGYHDNSFADAALRMGKAAEEGIGRYISLIDAYKYYLQARYANNLRMQISDFWGNASVAEGIEKSLQRVKQALINEGYNEDMFTKKTWIFAPENFEDFFKDTRRVNVKITKEKKNYKFTFIREPYDCKDYQANVLLTIPEIDYCETVTSINLYVPSDVKVKINGLGKLKDLDKVPDIRVSAYCFEGIGELSFSLDGDDVISLNTDNMYFKKNDD